MYFVSQHTYQVYSPNQNKSHSYGKFEDTKSVFRNRKSKKMKMTYNAMSNDQQKMTKQPKNDRQSITQKIKDLET